MPLICFLRSFPTLFLHSTQLLMDHGIGTMVLHGLERHEEPKGVTILTVAVMQVLDYDACQGGVFGNALRDGMDAARVTS